MESVFQSTDPQEKKRKRKRGKRNKKNTHTHRENCTNKHRRTENLSIGLSANCHYAFGGVRKNGKGKPREESGVVEYPSMETSRLCWTQRFLRAPLWLLGAKKLALDLFSDVWKRG